MTLVHELGRRGEEIAADFLAKRGYRIINRRFRTRSGEIDLVCGRGEVVVLVEVKTRSHDCWGSPAEAVDRQKRGYLERAAREYRVLSGWYGDIQLAVISVVLADDQEPRVELLEDPF